jgi:hypothetical protein
MFAEVRVNNGHKAEVRKSVGDRLAAALPHTSPAAATGPVLTL